MDQEERDRSIRLAAFAFLEEQVRFHGEVLPRTNLSEGFIFEGHQIPLISPQGIFKPAVSEFPLSITTAPIIEGRDRPYEDEVRADGLLLYRYRGTDPGHRDNVGLRRAMAANVPLVYLFGIVPGQYMPAWPVFVVADDPASLAFTVAVDDAALLGHPEVQTDEVNPRRAYVTRLVRHRLHQVSFRQRVIQAYQESCSVCRLHHRELLDAAHILPDIDPRSEPLVSNGLALCKLHHAAFDANILGISPELVIKVRTDILQEVDGPMLQHGLQGFDGSALLVPRRSELRPNRDFLAERYSRFREAG